MEQEEASVTQQQKFGDGIDWCAEARRAASMETPGVAPGEMHTNIRQALGDLKRPRIVDCGCNIARFYPEFRHAGFEYTGIDQSETALAIARERYPEAMFRLSYLWDDWPSCFAPFDAALCNAVLQHNKMEEKRRIMARIAQAVRPGGFFAMQESTVLEETSTQLMHANWITLVEGFGFKFLKTWHKNDEYGIEDAYLFQRIGAGA